MLQNEALETEANKPLQEPLQIIQPIKFFTPQEIQNIQEDLNKRKPPRIYPDYRDSTERTAKKRNCPHNIDM